MNHEGIAQVFDCGTSERGQPYFVMELVPGDPINRYCDEQRLSLVQRLQLVQQVCAAVQHAHQKGMVHRDLKPGNVLAHGDAAESKVKVIDFGLAKAMGEQPGEATLLTEAGQIVGTPGYMAPEQADPTNPDIDTRADVYALGVILYELLVGELPFPSAELRGNGLLEAQRILRHVDPPKPSARVSTAGDAATSAARARRTTVAALHRTLRTELDWVVLKAIDKDRSQRYPGASALAEDLQRFLDHEPLVAGPPSASYRLRKLVRRYRGQLVAVAAVVITSIVGAGFAIDYAAEASAQAALADRRAADLEKVAQFQSSQLGEVDPQQMGVRLRRGVPEQAAAPQTRAYSIRQRELGTGHPDALESINGHASLLGKRGEAEQAEDLLRSAIAANREVRAADDPALLTLRQTLDDDPGAIPLLVCNQPIVLAWPLPAELRRIVAENCLSSQRWCNLPQVGSR